MKTTQADRVLKHLKEHGSIDCNYAYQFLGIKHNSLARVIYDLRQRGIKIITKDRPAKNIFGEDIYISWYELPDEDKLKREGDTFAN